MGEQENRLEQNNLNGSEQKNEVGKIPESTNFTNQDETANQSNINNQGYQSNVQGTMTNQNNMQESMTNQYNMQGSMVNQNNMQDTMANQYNMQDTMTSQYNMQEQAKVLNSQNQFKAGNPNYEQQKAEYQITKRRSNYILIFGIIAIILVVLVFVFCGDIKFRVITEDNIEEIIDELAENNEDDFCYFAYDWIYYAKMEIDAGNVSSKATLGDEKILQNLYGKRVGKIIQEGKERLEESSWTLESFKRALVQIILY